MNSDIRFYWRLFLARLPILATIVVVCSAVGIGLALTLPPRYVATARLLVESPQIPDELAAGHRAAAADARQSHRHRQQVPRLRGRLAHVA